MQFIRQYHLHISYSSNNSISDKTTRPENKDNVQKASNKLGNLKKMEIVDKILIHGKVSCPSLKYLAESGFATTVLKVSFLLQIYIFYQTS